MRKSKPQESGLAEPVELVVNVRLGPQEWVLYRQAWHERAASLSQGDLQAHEDMLQRSGSFLSELKDLPQLQKLNLCNCPSISALAIQQFQPSRTDVVITWDPSAADPFPSQECCTGKDPSGLRTCLCQHPGLSLIHI